jgi:ssDNA-binding Zn-finger/Zn-ribbon topoisomerase 1
MVICPDCGKPVRYINAARGEDIFMVDVEPETLIGETGRIITGYREHKCPEEGAKNDDKENSP